MMDQGGLCQLYTPVDPPSSGYKLHANALYFHIPFGSNENELIPVHVSPLYIMTGSRWAAELHLVMALFFPMHAWACGIGTGNSQAFIAVVASVLKSRFSNFSVAV